MKNTPILVLILGLIVGYLIGTNTGDSSFEMMSRNHSQIRDTSDSVDMHGAMNGMMMGLSGKTGDALDLAFLNEMIIHHEGAVEMARVLLKGTKRSELIKLGNDIITAQTGEIKMMKEWRKVWFNQ